MSSLTAALIVLFALYIALVSWQMRRTFATHEPRARLTEARRLLLLTTLGVPLVPAFILLVA